jgi:hypothetical protein
MVVTGTIGETMTISEVKPIPHPTFPRWVMKNTSIYEGLINPVCAVNSNYPEFMFIPAVLLLLNYLGTKVQIEQAKIVPSLFLTVIGSGRTFKSSSVQQAVEYFRSMGIADYSNGNNGQSRIVTGLPSQIGKLIADSNNRNVVLFYDDLSGLTRAAQNGTVGALCTLYESGFMANMTKTRRSDFKLEPSSYCVSLIALCSDKTFQKEWAKLKDEGSLKDRFMFLLQPETLIAVSPLRHVNTVEGAVQTKKLIEEAIQQSVYQINDDAQKILATKINQLGNRATTRVEKLALYFAVDMSKNEIDESCVERAIAIVSYELAVKKYLNQATGMSREGLLQQQIIQFLMRSGGMVTPRQLDRELHPERYGPTLWDRVYNGLLQHGWIAETGAGTKDDPKKIVLMRIPEDSESSKVQ